MLNWNFKHSLFFLIFFISSASSFGNTCEDKINELETRVNRSINHYTKISKQEADPVYADCVSWFQSGGNGGRCTSQSSQWKRILRETGFYNRAGALKNHCYAPGNRTLLNWMNAGGFWYFKRQLLDYQRSSAIDYLPDNRERVWPASEEFRDWPSDLPDSSVAI